MSFKLVNLLLCFNHLKALTIEIILLVLSIILLILGIVGIIIIPWKITVRVSAILFYISLIFAFLSIMISLILIYLRKSYKLNKRAIKIVIISVIAFVFLCILAMVSLLVISFALFSSLNNKERITIKEIIEETGEVKKIRNVDRDIATSAEKVMSIIIISIMILLWIILLFLWVSEYIRLIFNTDKSYVDYVNYEKQRQLKHPIRYGLNVIGHDKYGFPIFGTQIGNRIKIKGVKHKYENKYSQINNSGKYVEDDGKINIKYYSGSTQVPMSQEQQNQMMQEKEKYMEKYYFQNYTNFDNKTIINLDYLNNSINPGYD